MVALVANRLADALKEPGCPLCNIYRLSAYKYVDHFVYLSVNDPGSRQRIVDSLGYCPEHTRLLAKTETENYGEALGTNILYEHLSREVSKQLKGWRPSKRAFSLQDLLNKIRNFLGLSIHRGDSIRTKEDCRVCQVAEEAVIYAAPTFLKELTMRPDEWQTAYLASDGLCLAHLRYILDEFGADYPEAARFLRDDTVSRLDKHVPVMKTYITKHSYDKKHIPLSEEEHQTWKQTLAFFTGFAPDTFTPFGDKED
jgi:hypothetical protein